MPTASSAKIQSGFQPFIGHLGTHRHHPALKKEHRPRCDAPDTCLVLGSTVEGRIELILKVGEKDCRYEASTGEGGSDGRSATCIRQPHSPTETLLSPTPPSREREALRRYSQHQLEQAQVADNVRSSRPLHKSINPKGLLSPSVVDDSECEVGESGEDDAARETAEKSAFCSPLAFQVFERSVPEYSLSNKTKENRNTRLQPRQRRGIDHDVDKRQPVREGIPRAWWNVRERYQHGHWRWEEGCKC